MRPVPSFVMYPKISARKAPRRALGSDATRWHVSLKSAEQEDLTGIYNGKKTRDYAGQYIDMVIGIRMPLPADILPTRRTRASVSGS